jgi:hypothetical protein
MPVRLGMTRWARLKQLEWCVYLAGVGISRSTCYFMVWTRRGAEKGARRRTNRIQEMSIFGRNKIQTKSILRTKRIQRSPRLEEQNPVGDRVQKNSIQKESMFGKKLNSEGVHVWKKQNLDGTHVWEKQNLGRSHIWKEQNIDGINVWRNKI